MLGLIPGLNPFPKIEIETHNSPLYTREIRRKRQENSSIYVEPYVINIEGIKEMIYTNEDTISGEVSINLSHSNITSFEHGGLKIELIGLLINKNKNTNILSNIKSTIKSSIESNFKNSSNKELQNNASTANKDNDNDYEMQITYYSKELDQPGIITKNSNYGFSFKDVKLPLDSYNGNSFDIIYKLKATLFKPFLNIKTTGEKFFKVINFNNKELTSEDNERTEKSFVQSSCVINYDNGINCGFTVNVVEVIINIYESIAGTIVFTSLPKKIIGVYITLIKEENINGSFTYENLIDYQVVDGNPEEKETYPFRIYLDNIDNITPTYKNIYNTFSVNYYIKFVVDDCYEKKMETNIQEITIFR